MMAYNDRSIHEHVIALAEKEGCLPALPGIPQCCHVYCKGMATEILEGWQVGRRKGTGLWRVSSPAQDAALVARAERNPSSIQGILELLLALLGKKTRLFGDLRQQVSGH